MTTPPSQSGSAEFDPRVPYEFATPQAGPISHTDPGRGSSPRVASRRGWSNGKTEASEASRSRFESWSPCRTEGEPVVGPGLPRKQREPPGLGLETSAFLPARVAELADAPGSDPGAPPWAWEFDSLLEHRLEAEPSVGTDPVASGCARDPAREVRALRLPLLAGVHVVVRPRSAGHSLRRSSKSKTRERHSRDAGAIPARRSDPMARWPARFASPRGRARLSLGSPLLVARAFHPPKITASAPRADRESGRLSPSKRSGHVVHPSLRTTPCSSA